MRDLLSNVTSISLVPTSSPVNDSDFVGATVDTYGEARKLYAVLSGKTAASGDGTISAVIQQSSDNSTWETLGTFDNLTDSGSVALDLSIGARYIRASITVNVGTATATYAAGVVGLFYNERLRTSNVALI